MTGGRRAGRGALVIGALMVAALVGGPAAASADPAYAPLDQPGVPLDVPAAKLRAALHCTANVRAATREPVLLNPATGVTVEQNYAWNWEPALTKLGIPWCAYDAPSHTLEDIQISGQYLVYAIRTMYAMAGRKIAVMGHSQGGMSMRWPLRFWPDTRAMVEDVIGFSGSNHGTTTGTDCSRGCPPADWQQSATAKFIAALNSYAETFAGISYTEIFTHSDEVVTPNSGEHASAALHTGGGAVLNVATQDVCPSDVYEHLTIGTIDPVAYAIAVDALTHPGPASRTRIPRSVCSQARMPGVNPLNLDSYVQILAGAPGLLAVATPGFNLVGVRETKAEPPLACYVFARCPGQAVVSGGPGGRCTSKRRFTLALDASLRRVTVRLDGKPVRVRRVHGRPVVTIDLRGMGPRTAVVTVRGVRRDGRRVTVTHRYHPCAAKSR
jgi:hypothetical protein